jgi:hypothetical protein
MKTTGTILFLRTEDRQVKEAYSKEVYQLLGIPISCGGINKGNPV